MLLQEPTYYELLRSVKQSRITRKQIMLGSPEVDMNNKIALNLYLVFTFDEFVTLEALCHCWIFTPLDLSKEKLRKAYVCFY